MCVCVCVCVCIYIYIYIERERERQINNVMNIGVKVETSKQSNKYFALNKNENTTCQNV